MTPAKQGNITPYPIVFEDAMQQHTPGPGQRILIGNVRDTITDDWFNPDFWQAQGKIYATKTGRASTYFFSHEDLKAVLRHYWRGGLIGKLLRDQYLFTGYANTRVWKEFSLLEEMHKSGLNVPEPIAARISRHGIIYRADIITRAIEGASSLLDILKERALSEVEIDKVANTLAAFHNRGIYHADLNINNILFDGEGKVYLIDFDRGEKRRPQADWQAANMARLARSFNKETGRQPRFHWTQKNWQQLEGAYRSALSEP